MQSTYEVACYLQQLISSDDISYRAAFDLICDKIESAKTGGGIPCEIVVQLPDEPATDPDATETATPPPIASKFCSDPACVKARERLPLGSLGNRIVDEFADLRDYIHVLDALLCADRAATIDVQTVRDRINPIRRRLAAIVNF